MRMRIYNFLVNRHAGIRSRYHRVHDKAGKRGKLLSWLYLLWLNFRYYVLLGRFLDEPEEAAAYERKKLLTEDSESASFLKDGMSVESFTERLSGYDAVSFDLFDTLIFRPFSEPTDLFFFLSGKLDLLDLKRIRTEQEALARRDCFQEKGHYEVTLEDIWKRLEREVGLSAAGGMEEEKRLEMEFCYANPFMLEVFRRLRSAGKKIIVISDMYLPRDFLRELLEKNGYAGISELYVSCEYGKSKRDGGLYRLVMETFGQNTGIVHVGDNEYSDIEMGRKSGFDTIYYPNVNKNARLFRPYDMSPMAGGAYRGIVDNHIYCGLEKYSMEYEYGFIYGGWFVLGYCGFIHEYCERKGIDKILFLSRDGDILRQAYGVLYPDEKTAYVYWSRKAAVKLEAEYNKADYFRRFLFHKANQGYSIREVLHSMELDFLAEGWKDGGGTADSMLTDRNAPLLRQYVEENWTRVLEAYREQKEAAKIYYSNILKGVGRAAAVDIGWAGSGAAALGHLVSRVWGMNCEIFGIVAGTNTVHNADPEASESFLQNGRMTAYLYSQRHNRDLWKKHDPARGYNVFWELLVSSPEPPFQGFCKEKEDSAGAAGSRSREKSGRRESVSIKPVFGKPDANQEGIREIQRGILDFVREYREHFRRFPYMLHISGRDAYAPMLAAAGGNERYLKAIERKFALKMNVE